MKKRNYIILWTALVVVILIVIALVFIVGAFFRSNMILPKQPPLTEQETWYFRELKERCGCNVIRELNPRASKFNEPSTRKGWYMLVFEENTCDHLQYRDSLGIVAEQVAHKLHAEVLGSEFEYNYESIVVSFECKTSATNYKSESFEYTKSELE